MRVLKIGGNELSDEQFLSGLAATVAELRQSEPVVIVHGGGRAIADLHTELGVPTIKVDGLRVTSARSLGIAEMVLSGKSNKVLVRALLKAGVMALGFSGVDAGLLTAQKKIHPATDLGYVGEIVDAKPDVIFKLVAQGFTPVISPISADKNGQPYNINADDAATAVAAAVQADLFDFISNVPGVLQDGELIELLDRNGVQQLIDQQVIYGGMIPKVRAALSALDAGVRQTRITNLAGLQANTGTRFHSK